MRSTINGSIRGEAARLHCPLRACAIPFWRERASRLHIQCISPASPLHLVCNSSRSHPYFTRISYLHLICISTASYLHLTCIFHASHAASHLHLTCISPASHLHLTCISASSTNAEDDVDEQDVDAAHGDGDAYDGRSQTQEGLKRAVGTAGWGCCNR